MSCISSRLTAFPIEFNNPWQWLITDRSVIMSLTCQCETREQHLLPEEHRRFCVHVWRTVLPLLVQLHMHLLQLSLARQTKLLVPGGTFRLCRPTQPFADTDRRWTKQANDLMLVKIVFQIPQPEDTWNIRTGHVMYCVPSHALTWNAGSSWDPWQQSRH